MGDQHNHESSRKSHSKEYKTWYNVKDSNNEEQSIDLGNIEWEKVPDTEINVASVSNTW